MSTDSTFETSSELPNRLRIMSYNIQVGMASTAYRHYFTEFWKHVLPHAQIYDNLSAIARRHNVRLADLCAWNGLTTKSIIQPGQSLVVQRVN